MNNLQMLKKAMLAYVSAVKFIWSAIAYPLSIVGKKLMNLRGYRVYGNSVQDGTPTPETPIEIESVGDLTEKNLFDVVNRAISVSRADEAYSPDTNTLKISSTKIGQYQANYYNIGVYSELKGKTLTVSYKYKTSSESKGYIRIGYINNVNFSFKDISSIVDVPNSPTEREITSPLTIRTDIDESNIKNDILLLVLYSNANGNVTDVSNMWIEYRDIQLEEGTTATDYEPYHKYKIPVVARGRNLIPIPTFSTFTKNGVKFTNNKDGSITINGTPTAYTATDNLYLPNSTLEILRNNVCVLTGFHNYEKNIGLVLAIGLNGNWIKYIYLNPNTYANYVKVDLTNVEFDKIAFLVRSEKNNVLINNLTVKPFLEVGTTMPKVFEPYIEPVTTNIFLDEPLRKVGDYADYIDFEKQKVVRNVNYSIFIGNEDITIPSAPIAGHTPFRYLALSTIAKQPFICNYFRFINKNYGDVGTGIECIARYASEGQMFFIVSNDRIPLNDITAFKNWLKELYSSGNPLKVYYGLRIPIEETVNLPAIPQFKGTTIYEVGTNIKPSGMEAKYC